MDDLSFLSSRGTGLDAGGLNPEFRKRLARALMAGEKATGAQTRITDLYRSPERQAQYYANYTGKPVQWGGKTYTRQRVGGLAAPPGKSRHQLGTGGDIGRGPVLDWLHSNADDYGLEFLSGDAFKADPVHIQMAGAAANLRSNESVERVAGGAGSDRQPGASGASDSGWNQPDFDPVSGGSKHAWRVGPGGQGQFRAGGRTFDYQVDQPYPGMGGGSIMSGALDGTSPGASSGGPPVTSHRYGTNSPGELRDHYQKQLDLEERGQPISGAGTMQRAADTELRPFAQRLDQFPKVAKPRATKLLSEERQNEILGKARGLLEDGLSRDQVERTLEKLGIDPSLL